ncbi:hypothetical protein [Streptomyces sp. NPDC047108]|uniref:hypothetical protein n=1 Tax=Streptomyces sp. NPDC047108 TaxID=3155025 RepID=UPI0033FD97D7
MSAMNRSARIVAIAAGLVLAAIASAPPALAERGHGGSTQTDGGEQDGELSATATSITFDTSQNGTGKTTGAVTPVGNWTPPACWYEPKWSPKEFKAYVEPIWEAGSTGYEWDAQQRERYEGGKPYKDFNLDKQGKGHWWSSQTNPDRIGDPGALDCDKPYFWVDTGEPPNVENAVTPEILAQLAYDKIRVPDTTVELSPQGKQTVNLATWAWLDQARFKPVKVTASLDALNLSATTTARPVSLKLEPGTKDATLHPGSGECPIGDDGRIGSPYTKGKGKQTPPCGLTYLRASADGSPYEFNATLTWEISWEGSNGQGGDLPNGTFGTTTDVTVQEVQAINR